MCSGCAVPSHAVVHGVHPSLGAVTLVGVPSVELGYPLVVHSEELGLSDDSQHGVVVVSGLFASQDDAQRFVRERGSGVVEALATPEEYRKRFGSEPDYRIVTVTQGGPVPAFSSVPDQQLWQKTPPNQTVKAASDCSVPAGARFALHREVVLEHYYAWVRVTCDGKPAYIRWIDTLLDATVFSSKDGPAVRQVVGAECDSPLVWEWPYTGEGKSGPGKAADPTEEAD